jgi:hypothetical protein
LCNVIAPDTAISKLITGLSNSFVLARLVFCFVVSAV